MISKHRLYLLTSVCVWLFLQPYSQGATNPVFVPRGIPETVSRCQVLVTNLANVERPGGFYELPVLPNQITPFSWADPARSLQTPLAHDFLNNISETGVGIVTVGGSSIHMILPGDGKEAHDVSAKMYYRESPSSAEEMAKYIADGFRPTLKYIANSKGFTKQHPPVVLIATPGQVIDHQILLPPANFATLARIGKPVPLADLVKKELIRTSEALGIPKEIMNDATVYVENDSLPVVANAVYRYMTPGNKSVVVFIGTGTGVAKVSVDKSGHFNMVATEEGHIPLKAFPRLKEFVPEHILIGAKIASRVSDTGALSFENVSAAGRVTDRTTGARSQLGGANSASLALLLPENEVPSWVRDRAGGDFKTIQDKVMTSFRIEGKEKLAEILENPEDKKLLEELRAQKSLSVERVIEAAHKGSILAQKVVHDNSFTQGIIAGLIALHLGTAPAGMEVTPHLAMEKTGKFTTVNVLMRATEFSSPWTDDTFFESAQKGLKTAIYIAFQTPHFTRQLQASGMSTNSDSLRLKIQRMVPAARSHPDMGDLDQFTKQLRFNLKGPEIKF